MKINEKKREEWECHLQLNSGDWIFIWLGHMRGDLYGNFSFKINNRIQEKGKGFHCRREWFDFMLDLPLGWTKTIDSYVFFGDNVARVGIDLETGLFQNEVNRVEELSVREDKMS